MPARRARNETWPGFHGSAMGVHPASPQGVRHCQGGRQEARRRSICILPWRCVMFSLAPESAERRSLGHSPANEPSDECVVSEIPLKVTGSAVAVQKHLRDRICKRTGQGVAWRSYPRGWLIQEVKLNAGKPDLNIPPECNKVYRVAGFWFRILRTQQRALSQCQFFLQCLLG